MMRKAIEVLRAMAVTVGFIIIGGILGMFLVLIFMFVREVIF